ncbi:hypothetical protein DIPPA_34471 [Diplonema papillatum]|nr:hypothetical protein DIPPA_34471 [Diplonema papillatum]
MVMAEALLEQWDVVAVVGAACALVAYTLRRGLRAKAERLRQQPADPRCWGKAPGPGSIMLDTFTDLGFLPFSMSVLAMQAAHPDVGAAVGSYSVVKEDPLGRLARTVCSLYRFMGGGLDGHQSRIEARDLRALHAHIKGTRPDGKAYQALDPHSFRIVPDTFLDGVYRYRKAIGRPLTAAEEKQLYDEYLGLCGLFGIDRAVLQDTLEEFLAYYDGVLLREMTRNETFEYLVLGELAERGPNLHLPVPLRGVFQSVYYHAVRPVKRIMVVGFLDPRFREKHGIAWSASDEWYYQKCVACIRLIVRLTPRITRQPWVSFFIFSGFHVVPIIDPKDLQSNT